MQLGLKKAQHFSCGEYIEDDITTGFTHHPRQKSPLQYLQTMVTHPLFKTKTPNTDGPKAGWVSQRCVLATLDLTLSWHGVFK